MVLHTFIGGTKAKASEVNENFLYVLRWAGLNLIRQLQDREVDISNDQDDFFGDAFVDATGRLDNVNTGSTTAIFSGDRYRPDVTNGTVENANTNTTDGSSTSFNYDITILVDGFLSTVRIQTTGSNFGGTPSVTISRGGETLAQKNGSSGVNENAVTFTKDDYADFLRAGDVINIAIDSGTPSEPIKTQSGVSYSQTNFTSSSATVNSNTTSNELVYTPVTVDTTAKIVYFDIPAGTIPAGITKAVLSALVEGWEDGITIDFKLTSGGDDSGWIDYQDCGSFSAFASAPTALQVRLTSKSGGEPGYPSIKGAVVKVL